MFRWLISIFFILLLVLAVKMVKTEPPGRLIVFSDSDPLDESAIRSAATPLLNRNAIVAVYLVEQGGTAEMDRHLQNDDVMRGNQIRNSLIAIFVSQNDRYSEIRYGDDWVSAIKPQGEEIRTGILGPDLREGAYNQAFTSTLIALEKVLAENDAAWEKLIYPDKRRVFRAAFAFVILLNLLWFRVLNRGRRRHRRGRTGNASGNYTNTSSNWDSSDFGSSDFGGSDFGGSDSGGDWGGGDSDGGDW